MTTVIGDRLRALLSRPWLPQGCSYCFTGGKAVIFVTGLCDDGCFYCPVSRERLGKDVFFVNEEKTGLNDVLVEIERSGAEGASITGGDPLIVFDRTIRLIKLLKENFGPSFHIHLYTSGRYASRRVLWSLYSAGLDEIRFHPTRGYLLSRLDDAVEIGGWSVGVEIPVARHLVEWAKSIVSYADKAGVHFVNLNEMEVSPANIYNLKIRGYSVSLSRPVVESAFKAGMEIVEWAVKTGLRVNVHFCPASYKDSIQTRNRFRRTCRLDAKPYEECTAEGTVKYGVLKSCLNNAFDMEYERLDSEYRLPPERVLVEELAVKYGCEGYIEEAHPTRLRVPVVESEQVYP